MSFDTKGAMLMARAMKPRTITMSDETFEGLKAVAMYQKFRGDRSASASKILEELGAEYLKSHTAEIAVIKAGWAAMENQMRAGIKPEETG